MHSLSLSNDMVSVDGSQATDTSMEIGAKNVNGEPDLGYFEKQKLLDMKEELQATPNRSPFRIRHFVSSFRGRDFSKCWPFSQKILEKSMRNGLRIDLPPFESAPKLMPHSNIYEDVITVAHDLPHMGSSTINLTVDMDSLSDDEIQTLEKCDNVDREKCFQLMQGFVAETIGRTYYETCHNQNTVEASTDASQKSDLQTSYNNATLTTSSSPAGIATDSESLCYRATALTTYDSELECNSIQTPLERDANGQINDPAHSDSPTRCSPVMPIPNTVECESEYLRSCKESNEHDQNRMCNEKCSYRTTGGESASLSRHKKSGKGRHKEDQHLNLERANLQVCPVCLKFSTISNTTLNAHIDHCLQAEPQQFVYKRRMKPKKLRSIDDIYAAAGPACTPPDGSN